MDSLFYVPIDCGGSVFDPGFVVHHFIYVLSSFAIILTRKRELTTLL